MTEQACLETPEDMAGKHPGPTSTSAIPCQQPAMTHTSKEDDITNYCNKFHEAQLDSVAKNSNHVKHCDIQQQTLNNYKYCEMNLCLCRLEVRVGGVGAVTRRRRLQ